MHKYTTVHTDIAILFRIKKELSSHGETCRKLKCMLLNERSQSEKAVYCMISTVWHSRKGKTMETLKTSGCWGEGERGMHMEIKKIFRTVKETIMYDAVVL